MRRWAASGLLAVVLLALLVRLSPLSRDPFWGADAGEYYRISDDLLRRGYLSTSYPGWGRTYPWFPGMFFIVDGLAFAGLDLPLALNIVVPALGALSVIPVFLIAASRTRDDRVGLIAAAIVAVAMPHVYSTAHAVPSTIGSLLVVSVLAIALHGGNGRRTYALALPAILALVVTHHLSAYFLIIALVFATVLRGILSPTVPRRELAADAGLAAFAFAAAVTFWIGYARPWRDLVAGEITIQPWWLVFAGFGLAIAALTGAIAVRRRLPFRYRPALPTRRHSAFAYGAGIGATYFVVLLATLGQAPGTVIALSPAAGIVFAPLLVLLAFSTVGRKAFDFARNGPAATAWVVAFGLSSIFGAVAAPHVLIPYRHVEYLVIPLAILAGVGVVRTTDLAGWGRRGRLGAACATVVTFGLAATTGIPPPALMANYDEGIDVRSFDAAYWARNAIPPTALVAADHRSSTVLFGFGRTDATWDTARLTFLATTFADAKTEMASLVSPSGKPRVDFVWIDDDAIGGLQLFPWEPAYPLSDAAVDKFARAPFIKVLDSGYARIYWVNWGLS